MAHSNKDKRSAVRRAQKVARKAKWASLIGTSKNRKQTTQNQNKRQPPAAKALYEVRMMIKGEIEKVFRMIHAGPRCYNTGCKRCCP